MTPAEKERVAQAWEDMMASQRALKTSSTALRAQVTRLTLAHADAHEAELAFMGSVDALVLALKPWVDGL